MWLVAKPEHCIWCKLCKNNLYFFFMWKLLQDMYVVEDSNLLSSCIESCWELGHWTHLHWEPVESVKWEGTSNAYVWQELQNLHTWFILWDSVQQSLIQVYSRFARFHCNCNHKLHMAMQCTNTWYYKINLRFFLIALVTCVFSSL